MWRTAPTVTPDNTGTFLRSLASVGVMVDQRDYYTKKYRIQVLCWLVRGSMFPHGISQAYSVKSAAGVTLHYIL